jgi:type III secretion system needle length determinant
MTSIGNTQAARRDDLATLATDRKSRSGPEPSGDDARRFQQGIREERAEQEEDSGSSGNAGEKSSLSDLMSRLFSERQGSAPASAAPPPNEAGAGAGQAEHLENTLERLVRHILVSPPERAESPEVRLVLEEKLLPDTEIHLLRDQDGLLRVTLTSGNASALQTLVSAQGDLAERLAARERRGVRVDIREIRAGDGSNRPDDASGRQSATYRAYRAHGEEDA